MSKDIILPHKERLISRKHLTLPKIMIHMKPFKQNPQDILKL